MNKNLIIVRHGIAEDREVFAKTNSNDKKRPLTPEGVKKMKSIGDWLESKLADLMSSKMQDSKKNKPDFCLDYICESPLLRSKQTANILSKKIPFDQYIELKSLDPETSLEVLAQNLDSMVWSNLLMVGHEPQLSLFLSFILGNSSKGNVGPFKFKKGGIAIVKVNDKLMDQKSELSLFVAPKFITT